MYAKIKELADEAIALQNKNRMDEVLREISGLAMQGLMLTMFEDARIAKWGSEPCPECMKPRARCAPVEDGAEEQRKLAGEVAGNVLLSAEMMPAVKQYFDAGMANAAPSDTVQIAGIENTETGESKLLDVKVTPPATLTAAAVEFAKETAQLAVRVGKKGGAK